MFQKYFNGVIEQVYNRIDKTEKNVVMVFYNNIFSVCNLESIKRYSQMEDDAFFAWKEYDANGIVGAYDPFLELICQMYRKHVNGDFDAFLTQCEVYELHRQMLKSYYECGVCTRIEQVLPDEVEYEQKRLTKTILLMLKAMAEYQSIVLVINRFQMASASTMQLVRLLIEQPSGRIGLILGANESGIKKESDHAVWDSICEQLEDRDSLYHLGSTEGVVVQNAGANPRSDTSVEDAFVQLKNVIELLDFRQANRYLTSMERKIRFEGLVMSDEDKRTMYLLHINVSIMLEDISRALDLIEELAKIKDAKQDSWTNYYFTYYIATCYMYQGKLEVAYQYAEIAKFEAEHLQDEMMIFKAELLMAQTRMAGWHNIFFCVQEVRIDEQLIEKMMRYHYRNHLAHVYVYAYDNRPEIVAKAYRSEAALVHFSKGIAIAKAIGNEQLVYNAYQKNIMIASTNGMNEIALLYSIRTYQFIKDNDLQAAGRVYSAVGYNLSALGRMEESAAFYEKAIRIFYQLQLPEDIAEVYYNFALTKIAQREYAQAEEKLQIAIKISDKLHLNSLRVCNLAKLYALAALLSTMQGNRFDSERYLLSCSQFLNYILEKQYEEVVHDFAKSDDDIFIYLLAKAMHEMSVGDEDAAYEDFERAEEYFVKAEGNMFFIHELYRKSRMELFRKLHKDELYDIERASWQQHREMVSQLAQNVQKDLLADIEEEIKDEVPVTRVELERLVKQESLAKENARSHRDLEFISIWQNHLDKSQGRLAEVVKKSMRLFLNRFGTDCALYVRYNEGVPKVLYNDTGVCFVEENLKMLEEVFLEQPAGFAVSKISHTFQEHRDVIRLFGADEVCSFVAVPFVKNGTLESFFITYIKMKDNWHDSINRYLLNDEDLRVYQLLFRELSYTMNRMESYEKINDMNLQLREMATTDSLTGIINRTGLNQMVDALYREYEEKQIKSGVAVLFIDLDNFKPYNDTYGHDIGDVVLREMATIFKDVVGRDGFVCRQGGDEFLIIARTASRKQLVNIVERIYASIERAEGFAKNIEKILGKKVRITKEHSISCSIGIATAKDFRGEKTIARLIRKADDALYHVKADGKGKYEFS